MEIGIWEAVGFVFSIGLLILIIIGIKKLIPFDWRADVLALGDKFGG